MFQPTLSKGQRRQATDLHTRLAAAKEPSVIEDSPKLAPLLTRREELTREIAGIERGAGDGNLEETASLLANRRAQLHLVELQISELQGARSKAEEIAQKQSAATLDSLSGEAEILLVEVATSFQRQHKEALEAAIAQYAVCHSAEARNLIQMIPWFLQYLQNIRAFRDGYTAPAQLVEWLEAALNSEDFLMKPRS